MILLDTHVLVWLVEGNPRLGKKALEKIDGSLASASLSVATISFWEIAMLVQKKRLSIQMELATWRTHILRAGVAEIPLTGAAAIRAGQMKSFHGDPADRMIVATAMEKAASLMTADEKILRWKGFRNSLDAGI